MGRSPLKAITQPPQGYIAHSPSRATSFASSPSPSQGQPLVPWCLPNTADRHNGWRGLFGRLDWQGHFPTSTTDPQPMGKVGQGRMSFQGPAEFVAGVRGAALVEG